MLELHGSSATSVTPRVEPKLAWMIPASPASVGFRQTALAFSSVNVAPPSVDLYRPYGGSPGAKETVPPLVTDETPRTPRVDPTYIVLPSTTIDEIERPSKAGPLYAGAVRMPPKPNTASQSTVSAGTLVTASRCVQVSPPSVDLKMPRPASESADALASPVPA